MDPLEVPINVIVMSAAHVEGRAKLPGSMVERVCVRPGYRRVLSKLVSTLL
jgi:hypothetical protein